MIAGAFTLMRNESDLEPSAELASASFSKRAARRLIQRAFVLAGRNRRLREHIRDAHLAMLWRLEDWNFEWTVVLERGRLLFDRRPVRSPDLTMIWESAADFFSQVEQEPARDANYQLEGDPQLRRIADVVYRTLHAELARVLRFPFDDAGNRIA